MIIKNIKNTNKKVTLGPQVNPGSQTVSRAGKGQNLIKAERRGDKTWKVNLKNRFRQHRIHGYLWGINKGMWKRTGKNPLGRQETERSA